MPGQVTGRVAGSTDDERRVIVVEWHGEGGKEGRRLRKEEGRDGGKEEGERAGWMIEGRRWTR